MCILGGLGFRDLGSKVASISLFRGHLGVVTGSCPSVLRGALGCGWVSEEAVGLLLLYLLLFGGAS